MLMAGLDGIQNKIHPGEPMDKDLYDLPPKELKEIPTVCGSLREALESLDADRDFLKAGDVFDDDQIDAYIELKMEEVDPLRNDPAPGRVRHVLQRLTLSVQNRCKAGTQPAVHGAATSNAAATLLPVANPQTKARAAIALRAFFYSDRMRQIVLPNRALFTILSYVSDTAAVCGYILAQFKRFLDGFDLGRIRVCVSAISHRRSGISSPSFPLDESLQIILVQFSATLCFGNVSGYERQNK